MADKSLTLKGSLDLETFDPMNIDISEFKELAARLPQDNNFDIAICEQLAVVYLRAADRCSEIHSTLLHYTQKMKLEKNTVRQKLYLLSKNEGYKTVEERKAYAESHSDYIMACEKLVEAETVKTWFEEKQKWFLKSHQYMKDKLKAEQQHMMSSGFSETVEVKKNWGEKDW